MEATENKKERRMKEKPVTAQQIKALHAMFSRSGMDDDDRHRFISEFTGGRTDSTKGLTLNEARRILDTVNANRVRKANEEARALVKQIFALSFQISCLNKGYGNESPEDVKMNIAKVNKFCRTHSKFRKPVTEMNTEELKEVKKQLEAMAYRENKES